MHEKMKTAIISNCDRPKTAISVQEAEVSSSPMAGKISGNTVQKKG